MKEINEEFGDNFELKVPVEDLVDLAMLILKTRSIRFRTKNWVLLILIRSYSRLNKTFKKNPNVSVEFTTFFRLLRNVVDSTETSFFVVFLKLLFSLE